MKWHKETPKPSEQQAAPAAVVPPVPVTPEPLKQPQGVLGVKYPEPIGPDWSEKNKEWLAKNDRTGYVKGDPCVGGQLVAVYSHKANITECGEIRKGQHGYVPALTYKWLHNFLTPVDQADADAKVKKAEAEYSKL